MNRFIVIALSLLTVLTTNAQLNDDSFVFANCEHMAYVIDVPEARFYDGAKLQVWEYYSNSSNQHLRIEKRGNDCVIRTAFNTNLAFDVTDGKVAGNNPVQLWSAFPDNNIQRWKFEHISGVQFIIRSALDRNYVLAAPSPVRNGSKLCIQKYTGADNQKWFVFPLKSNMYMIYKGVYDKAK